MSEIVNAGAHHPDHYGGKDDPYEAIKVIEAWGLDFALGSALKYIRRAGKKPGASSVEDLRKASWYVLRACERAEGVKCDLYNGAVNRARQDSVF